MSASLGWSFLYCGTTTGPSTAVDVVEVDVVEVVLVDPVVLPPTGAPDTQKDALPPTPKLIAALPDWWAPTSGAA
jgi:hypothetical protein